MHQRNITCRPCWAVGLLLLALALPWRQLAVPSTGDCPRVGRAIPAALGGHTLQLELATTPGSRRCGLSRRDGLAWDRGMLFLFPEARRAAFWMRDTRIPLSLAFLDRDGRILAIEQMAPDAPGRVEPVRYQAPVAVSWVVELNAGWFAAHDVGVGDRLQVELAPGLVVR